MGLKDIQKPKRMLTLYHGSPNMNIKKFDISYSRKSFLDFGIGIYFTTNIEQAMLWSIKKSTIGAVYEVPFIFSELNVKQYLTYSNEFIKTFCLCRAGFEKEVFEIADCDAVYGYVIDNDKEVIVKKTYDYAIGKITEANVRSSIRLMEGKDQVCIKKQSILNKMMVKNIRLNERVKGFPPGERRSVKWKK